MKVFISAVLLLLCEALLLPNRRRSSQKRKSSVTAWGSAEMQAIEQEANARGLTYSNMMDNAGRNLGEAIVHRYGQLKEQGVMGLVGSGNNGGDTLVALILLARLGWKTTAYLCRRRGVDDPLVKNALPAGCRLIERQNDLDLSLLKALIGKNAMILAGILGTGARLPLKPEVAEILAVTDEAIKTRRSEIVVVAVDCPSGIDCDTGEAAPQTIPADLTVTMAAIKQGLLKFPAYSYLGALELVGIGLPENGEGLRSWDAVSRFIPEKMDIQRWLPARSLAELQAREQADRANGNYGRQLLTEMGTVLLQVPRTRRWSAVGLLQAYRRRSLSVDRAILGCFLLGLSTRKVARALLPMLGESVSAATVSNISKSLDVAVAAFHRRRIHQSYRVLVFDGVVLSRKTGAGAVRRPVLVALGIRHDGRKEIIDFRQAHGESTQAWEAFLNDLHRRGLDGEGLELICSDGGTGLRAALPLVYPQLPVQLGHGR